MKSARQRGFTLIEIVVSVAIVGLLLVALNTFVFSMGELWGRGSDSRLFDQHVRNVSRFLERELRSAAFPPNVAPGTAGIVAKEIKAVSGTSGPMLTFELKEGSRLLVWPVRPLPDVVCALTVRDGAGLLLLWHSRLEKNFEDDAPRETPISPFVTAIAYDYYDPDTKNWRSEDRLRSKRGEDGFETPQRIRLTFKHGALEQNTSINLPSIAEGIPFF